MSRHSKPRKLLIKVIIPLIAAIAASICMFIAILNDYISESNASLNNAFLELRGRDIFNICEINFGKFSIDPDFGSTESTDSLKKLTISEIENILISEGIDGAVIGDGRVLLTTLNGFRAPMLKHDKGPLKIVTPKGVYYGYHFYFSPWDWHLLTFMDSARFSSIKKQTKIYIILTCVTFFLLIGSVVFILRTGLQKPLSTMLTELKKHGSISTGSGTEELDILSAAINSTFTELRKLKNAIDQAAEAIIITDIGGNIEYVNPAFEKITGYDLEEAMGSNTALLIPNVDDGKLNEKIWDTIRNGEKWEGSFENRKKSGEPYTEEMTVTPVKDPSGAIGHFVAIKRDVSERKTLQEQALQAQKMESVGQLAGGIAHDFNNLLTGILGNVCLAKMQVPPQEKKLLERLDAAETATDRAKDLTQRLLTFASGGAPVRRSISVTKLIRDGALLALSGSKTVCEFSFPDDTWPVYADQGQISQVVGNIVINADQAMPEGGKISVTCENVTTVLDDSGDSVPARYVRISIIDEGMGISPEHLGRIFDPYFSTKEKGRGLGLTSTYSIIKNHQGWISVKSKKGSGTTFVILLPASESPVMNSENEDEMPLKGSGKILVMDDDEFVREVAAGILSHVGYEVGLAKDGKEAVEIYRGAMEAGSPYRAVIMDLTIPGGMGGKEALQHLLKIDPKVKAIVSSGYSNDPVMSRFQEYGFAGVVSKPYRVGELGRQIDSILRS